jgi:hypothetical protein
MSFRQFVDTVASQNQRTGGDFLKMSDGPNIYRLFLFKDIDGLSPGLSFWQHWVDRKSHVCQPKTFGTGECSTCRESELLRDSDKERARSIAARPAAWLVAMPKDLETCGILAVTGSTMAKILTAVAQVGGWSGEEEWGDPEFLACIDKGQPQCFGEEARDLIITKNKGGAPKDMYKVRFTQNKGKKRTPASVLNLREIFTKVKDVESGEEQKPVKTKAKTPATRRVVKKGK